MCARFFVWAAQRRPRWLGWAERGGLGWWGLRGQRKGVWGKRGGGFRLETLSGGEVHGENSNIVLGAYKNIPYSLNVIVLVASKQCGARSNSPAADGRVWLWCHICSLWSHLLIPNLCIERQTSLIFPNNYPLESVYILSEITPRVNIESA